MTEAAPDGALRAPTPGGEAGPPRRPAPLDTVYADSGLYADPALDSLVAADTVEAPAAPPDFRVFWPRFRDAVRAGEVAALAAPGGAAAFEARGPVVFVEPFRAGVLALGARDFRRAGTAREASVTVGYDRAGPRRPRGRGRARGVGRPPLRRRRRRLPARGRADGGAVARAFRPGGAVRCAAPPSPDTTSRVPTGTLDRAGRPTRRAGSARRGRRTPPPRRPTTRQSRLGRRRARGPRGDGRCRPASPASPP